MGHRRYMAVAVTSALLLPEAVLGQYGRIDLRAYQPATLASVFAAVPKAPAAAIELPEADELARADATYTGNERRPRPDLYPLIAAWAQQRQLEMSVINESFHEREVEFEEGSRRYWMLIGYPASFDVRSVKPGQRLALFLHRIGFASGRPVVVVHRMGTPTGVAAELVKPAQPRAVGSDIIATYGRGQLRFEYKGKTHVLPVRPSQGTSDGLKMYAGREALFLQFGDQNGPGHLSLIGLHGPGEYVDYDRFRAEVHVGGELVYFSRSHLTDCKLAIVQLNVDGARGTLSCRRASTAAPSELDFPTAMEFSVSR